MALPGAIRLGLGRRRRPLGAAKARAPYRYHIIIWGGHPAAPRPHTDHSHSRPKVADCDPTGPLGPPRAQLCTRRAAYPTLSRVRRARSHLGAGGGAVVGLGEGGVRGGWGVGSKRCRRHGTRWAQLVSACYRWLQVVTGGYRWLRGGYRWLRGGYAVVTRGGVRGEVEMGRRRWYAVVRGRGG